VDLTIILMLNNWINLCSKLLLIKHHGNLECFLIKNDKGKLGYKAIYLRLKFRLDIISTNVPKR
jgi:hypothetical protein